MRQNPTSIISSIALLVTATAADAEDWRIASIAAAGGKATVIFFVDADTIRKTGTTVRFWVDERLENATEFGFNRSLQLMEANCDDQSYVGLQVQTYFAATPLEDLGAMGRSYAAPGTTMGTILTHVCEGDYSETVNSKNDRDQVTRMLFGEQWFKKPRPNKRSYKPYYPPR
jgi:hypothetical protein